MAMNDTWRRLFEDPGRASHSLPFWGWNDVLTEEEVTRQIEKGAEAGIAGFFVHSRDGLETPYMGETWFACLKRAVKEAKERGLQIWLYDEDRWPSGTAGGEVTSQGDAFRCKGLTMEVLEPSEAPEILRQEIQSQGIQTGTNEAWIGTDETNGLVAVYAARVRDMEIHSFRRLSESEIREVSEGGIEESADGDSEALSDVESAGADSWKPVYLLVRMEVSAKSEWFNWEAPPDNLNPETARQFLACTHERYKEQVGEDFGTVIPGIFTDEPSLHDRHAFFGEKRGWIPWTYGLSRYFREQKGYDFLDYIPDFYFHGKDSRWVRHDYWQVMSRRYGEASFQIIGDWCRKNHLKFTGHFLQEDRMGLCARVNGSAMPHYVYQDVPGIDMLTEQTREFLTVKQCTSVASQFGKKQVLTETYGCTGWDFTFEGQKWMGDWQFVLGVTMRCQHIALYSLRGCRKRDYPPSFNYNNNWWKENRYVEAYFGRLSAMLTEGQAVRRVLLLHPVSTVWSRLGTSPYGNPVRRQERDVAELDRFGDRFNDLLEWILRRHVDCDLGDEELLASHGSVEGTKLRLGDCTYDLVIVPEMDTMYGSTCRLLKEMGDAGGSVLFCGAYPQLVEGRPDSEGKISAIPSRLMGEREQLLGALEEVRTVSVKEGQEEATDVLYQLRQTEYGAVLFLVNNSRKRAVRAIVEVSAEVLSGSNHLVEQLNPLDGRICPAVWEKSERGITFSVSLPPVGSCMYVITDEARCDQGQRETSDNTASDCAAAEVVEVKKLGREFSYTLSGEDTLPLDLCRYRLQDGSWSSEMEVWQAQKEIRETLGMRPIHLNGIEQRYKWVDTPHAGDGVGLQLAFSFVSQQGGEKLGLLMETPEYFSVKFNGEDVSCQDQGWFLDRSLRRISLGDAKQGTNEVLLSCSYRNKMELENIYLIGTFGVAEDRSLTKLPKMLKVGDWCAQGLKHYCGNVTYEMDVFYHEEEGMIPYLRIPKAAATAMLLHIGEETIPILWNLTEPVSLEGHLTEGRNLLKLEVLASPRNMMGPFHGATARPVNVHDASFCPSPQEYTKEYQLVEYGILEEPELVLYLNQFRL